MIYDFFDVIRTKVAPFVRVPENWTGEIVYTKNGGNRGASLPGFVQYSYS